MGISTSAFKDGGKIPLPYVMPGGGGKNISIPLESKNIPPSLCDYALCIKRGEA